MIPMHTFRSLHALLKDAGQCSYAATADKIHGTRRHTLTFSSEAECNIPPLDDSAEFSMRYSEARVAWQLQGRMFGHSTEDDVDVSDPAIFFARVAAKAKARVVGMRHIIATIQAALAKYRAPVDRQRAFEWFLCCLNDVRTGEWVQVYALAPDDFPDKVVGGLIECNDVSIYFSHTKAGLQLGFFEPVATHLWPVDQRTLDMMERRCEKYLADVQHLAEEAVRAVQAADVL